VAAAIGARIGLAGVEVGILDTIEKPSRSDGLTLLIAREGAVAQTRIVLALNAKRIAVPTASAGAAPITASPLTESKARTRLRMKSPFGRSRLLIDSFGGNPSRSRRFPSTHVRGWQRFRRGGSAVVRQFQPALPKEGSHSWALASVLPEWTDAQSGINLGINQGGHSVNHANTAS